MEKNKIQTRILIKIISTILTTIILLQICSPIALGIKETENLQNDINEEYVENKDAENSINDSSSTEIIGEITEKRTLNQKHFLQSDGTILTGIYPTAVHYEENGKLVDIDNSLEDVNEDNGMYQNKNNIFKVKFSKKSNKNNLVKLNIKNHNIKWALLNSNKVEAKKIGKNDLDNSKLKLNNIASGIIEYENILENIDLQYNVVSNSIKENIILKDKAAINQEISFEFKTDNLKMEKTEDNRIAFSEKNQESVIFILEAPYMYDAKNELCDDVQIDLTEKNNKYIMTLKPSREWLENEERVYPVVIDPTVQTSLDYHYINDVYIFDGDAGYPNRHEAHILRVGSNNKLPSKGPTRSLLKFAIPNLNSGDQIISAMLDICSYPDTNEWAPATQEIQIDVHKMTSNWETRTASWSNLYNQYDSKIVDYVKYKYDSNNPIKFYYFDITSIVKDWYITGNNYGVLLKDHTETYNAQHSDAYFYSSDVSDAYTNARPMIQMVYRNQTGIEDYQTYHTQSIGRAGTVYTNDYNGNLVLTHQDSCTGGNLLPVTVNHVYNTNDKDVDIGYGKGYRLNLSQIINLVTINNVEYAKYIDEDGTQHYFKREGTSNIYKDEDGLNLTLTLENDNFIMKDKNNSTLIFQKRTNSTGIKWHLKELKDTFGNKITLNLNTNTSQDFRIEKVIDGAGEEISFSYDNTLKLSKITDKAGRIITFGYNSNNNMTQVTYHDNKTSTYSYNSSNLLTSVKNIDNSYMNYEYYYEKGNKVKSIKEYGTQNILGKSLNISYGTNITKFTDNKGYTNIYTFNNYGQTISIADLGKDANNVNNALGKMYKYGEENNNKNKLTLDGNLISINEKENNLLKNANFDEGSNYWTNYHLESCDQVVDGKYRFVGNSNIDKHIGQELHISGKKGDIFTFAGWVNSKAVPNSSEKNIKVSLSFHFYRNDGTIQMIDNNINVDGNDWQFVSTINIADSDYYAVKAHLVCTNNANETYFDNVGLFKEEFGQSYIYDSNGNIISTEDNSKNNQIFKYNSDNKLISSINPKGGEFTYQYDINNTQKLNSAINAVGNKYSFNYDNYGNITSAKVEEINESDIGVQYQTHIANEGWKGSIQNGETSGSSQLNNQLEAIKINLTNPHSNIKVEYSAHVANIGWQDWVQNGTMAGTEGQSLRMEAIKIKLVNTTKYSVRYRTYVSGLGWQSWVQDGEISGTTGQYKPIYAIQIVIEDNERGFIQTQTEYSSNGNYQTKLIDEAGNTTQYQYNQHTGLLTKTIDAKNKETNYTYDTSNRLLNVKKQVSQKEYSNTYTYENDMLKTITHNGFIYTFNYDNFGNVKQVKVGNQILSTNNYENNNGNLVSATYGNNQTISYSYDRFNRITKMSGTNGNYQYTYNANANVKTIVDGINNNTETFTYDLAERLVKSINTNGFIKEYGYDANNNVNTKKYTLSNRVNSLQYDYDKANRLTSLKLNNSIAWTNTMDRLSRLSINTITSGSKSYKTSYSYIDVPNVTNKTTTLLKSVKNGNNAEITYTYDGLGNIETIKEGNTLTNKYYYDELSQLKREDNVKQNKTIAYEYDTGGNILNKKEYSYTTSATLPTTPNKIITYTYGNTNWKDQLTSYNGKQITYDNIGNVLTYDGNNYTWQNGRQLAGISNSSKNQTIKYKYNENGIRTQKVVNGTITNYYLEGSKVIYEQRGNNIIYYIYDQNGNIIGLKYNDTQYYYIKNAQNDIIGILDSNLNQVVRYEYDSWGNTLSIKDINGNNIKSDTNIGVMNPYRYRGYRYDTDSGLYYLQSRYYNPEWGRFINFDNYGGQLGELLSHNGYIYCNNNPINMIDEDGNFAISLAAILSTVIAAVKAVVYTVVTVASVVGTAVATEKVIETVKDRQRKNNEKSHTVYKLTDSKGKVQYVGRTVNEKARKAKHKKNHPTLEFQPIVEGLTREQARGVEQIYMVEYNTRSLLNKINGINPKNIKREIYMEAGRQILHYLGNVVSNEALYWTGQ